MVSHPSDEAVNPKLASLIRAILASAGSICWDSAYGTVELSRRYAPGPITEAS